MNTLACVSHRSNRMCCRQSRSVVSNICMRPFLPQIKALTFFLPAAMPLGLRKVGVAVAVAVVVGVGGGRSLK